MDFATVVDDATFSELTGFAPAEDSALIPQENDDANNGMIETIASEIE